MIEKKIGVLVESNGQAFIYAEKLNNEGLGAMIFNSSTDLFEAILKNKLDIVIIDSELMSEDATMISRYRLMCPNLIIVILGETNNKRIDYLMADCDFFLNSSDLIRLVEYVHVLLKRTSSQVNDTKKNIEINKTLSVVGVMASDHWCLSITDYNLYAPNGTAIKLTMREFKFLMLLFHCSDTAVNKSEIVKNVIGRNYDTADQRIALMVTRLRKKVLKLTSSALPIKSDYTNGYLFAGKCFVEKRQRVVASENIELFA